MIGAGLTSEVVLVDPKTHRIYLPPADFQPAARPAVAPNAMRGRVFGTE